MPKREIVVTVFISSPSDVAKERESVERVIKELNVGLSKIHGVRLHAIRWETDIRPSFGDDPQAVINEQIENNYDIFLGILWARIGTATKRAESGTVEEFENAFARFQRDRASIELMLYFKDGAISPSADTDQLGKVQHFRKEVGSLGGLYASFKNVSAFETMLRQHLRDAALNRAKHLPEEQQGPMLRMSVVPKVTETNELEDWGIYDFLEAYAENVSRMGDCINGISSFCNELTEKVTRTASDLNGVVNGVTNAGRLSAIIQTAKAIESFSTDVELKVQEMSVARGNAFNFLSSAVALIYQNGRQSTALAPLKDGLLEMSKQAKASKIGFESMRSSLLALPNLKKELNVSKRNALIAIDRLLLEIDDTSTGAEEVASVI